ncbi:hypothetical protein F1D05_32185 [Kribbella qitaiheensis]|uniref:Lipoprotein n=1 Tax=Kribbella qitaiheensis TaxID=1544730 RepID=A0A7G6X665_9ACTN|nr:hypothetical protein [Kribbella qitaiheensis]QNE21730.1 hypothetical protein F1D05_32185 [Kribbella qitaiheensis]
MSRRVLARVTVGLAVVSLVAACDNAPSGSATPPPFTPSPAPTSAVTTSAAPQAAAAAGAQAGYRKYIEVKDATQASGGSDTKGLSQVAIGAILGSELNQAATFRARKWRGTGKVEVIWTKVLKFGPTGTDGQISEVTVQACYDSSKSVAVDASGKSVKKPGTPTRWLDEMQMRANGGAWKASFGLNKAAAC